ncbi:MAG: thioredoxin family protein [Pyrinomonadaceae bacterium]
MKKLARFALLVTLSAVYPTPSKPSVASERSSMPTSPMYDASTALARPSFAAPSSAVPTLPNENWLYGAAGYARAVELQRTLNIPLVVYFYTDWCPYCRTLDSQYLPSAPVQAYLRGVVKVRINPEQGLAERALGMRYGVSGFPSFFVMRHSAARPVNVHPFRRVGTLTPTQFANACRAIAPVSRKLTAVRSSEANGRSSEGPAEVVTKKTTTSGGSQIVTVIPSASASPRVRPRRQ